MKGDYDLTATKRAWNTEGWSLLSLRGGGESEKYGGGSVAGKGVALRRCHRKRCREEGGLWGITRRRTSE